MGVKDYPSSSFRQTIKLMLFYHDELNELRKKMQIALDKTPYVKLLDVWGYRLNSLACIVGQVGDIRRFANHKKFVGYCGLNISEKQSGSMNSKSCFITKKGNSILRFTFYTLVLCHLSYKKPLSEFYDRLKKSGKHPKKCMTAAARKLAVKTYYDMLKCHGETTISSLPGVKQENSLCPQV